MKINWYFISLIAVLPPWAALLMPLGSIEVQLVGLGVQLIGLVGVLYHKGMINK